MLDLNRELQSCGMSFFVEYYERFCRVNWHDDMDVRICEQEIMQELSQKSRPDGGRYAKNGLSIRLSSVFLIFAQGMQYEALNVIVNSSHTTSSVRAKAQEYLNLEIKKRREQEEFMLKQKKAEQERIHREEEERIAREQRQKIAEQERIRREEEERIAQEQKKEAVSQIMFKISEQDKVLAGTNKWVFWGKNAKLRKETIRNIKLLKNELSKYTE